jgi:hypothetical protein
MNESEIKIWRKSLDSYVGELHQIDKEHLSVVDDLIDELEKSNGAIDSLMFLVQYFGNKRGEI